MALIYQLITDKTPEYAYWQSLDQVESAARAERLRYIAVTRAKERFVFNKLPINDHAKIFAAPLYDVQSVKTEKITPSDLIFDPDRHQPELTPRFEPRMKIEWEYIQKSLTHALAKTARPSLQIMKEITPCNELHPKVRQLFNTPAIANRMMNRATIGSLANKLLANPTADLATAAKTLIADTGSNIDRCILVKIVSNLGKTALQKRIDEADIVLREIPIKFQHRDGVFHDGVVDLLFKEGDEWVLVDYQAIRVNQKCHSGLSDQKHRERMLGYAEGLRKMGIRIKASLLASD